jgi:hypothetical protein
MKMNHIKFTVLIAVLSLSFVSCSSDPWEEVLKQAHENQFTAENVEDFHAKTYTSLKAAEIDESKVDIYVDLSDGIAPAWADDGNKELFKTIINRTTTRSTIVPMGRRSKNAPKEDIGLSIGMSQGAQIELLMNPESASKLIYAQIQSNLDSIVLNNREAIFISDFEEYRESQSLKVAKVAIYNGAFEKWLDKGHNLHLYRLPYMDGEKSKNLIIAMFCSSQSSTVNGLIQKIEEEKGVSPDVSFVHNPFKINYQDSISTDLHGTILYGDNGYETNGHKDWTTWNTSLGYEIHSMQADWEYFLDKDFLEVSKGRLSEGLLLNTSASNYMTIKGLNVSVMDITSALELNSEVNFFEDVQSKIELTKDPGGNIVWSDNDTINYPYLNYVFEENTRTLKDLWSKPTFSQTYKELPFAIQLDQKLFDDLMKNDPSKVKVHSKLNPNKINSYRAAGDPFGWSVLLDVDNIEVNLDYFDSYIFTDPKGNVNKSLSESLKNVSLYWEQQLLEKESRIYTYYITKE